MTGESPSTGDPAGAPAGVELVFVHVPKAGGSSIVSAIREKYADEVYLDYSDRILDPQSEFNTDFDRFIARDHTGPIRAKRAITGHFSPLKYRSVPADRSACVLRDPVQRAISNYFFWKARKPVPANSLNMQFHAESPTIEEFVQYPTVRFFYTKVLFRGVDMRRIDHVFDYRDLAEKWETVMDRLCLPRKRIVINETRDRFARYDEKRQEIEDDAPLTGRLRQILQDDIRFYERWTGRDAGTG